ncbi:unnamed protein product [Moneuplotes crassus]|uniref:Uncharacterized protein n=1 Tax=Euplotes crassus TaxID=5936 RepID=A0AAD1X5Q7_EUPCR|nr:unnamed protein product [Moneuplotes crassus]
MRKSQELKRKNQEPTQSLKQYANGSTRNTLSQLYNKGAEKTLNQSLSTKIPNSRIYLSSELSPKGLGIPIKHNYKHLEEYLQNTTMDIQSLNSDLKLENEPKKDKKSQRKSFQGKYTNQMKLKHCATPDQHTTSCSYAQNSCLVFPKKSNYSNKYNICSPNQVDPTVMEILNKQQEKINQLINENKAFKTQLKELKDNLEHRIANLTNELPLVNSTQHLEQMKLNNCNTDEKDKSAKINKSIKNEKVFRLTESSQPILVTIMRPDDPTSEGTAKLSSNLNAKMSNLSNKKKSLGHLEGGIDKSLAKEEFQDENIDASCDESTEVQNPKVNLKKPEMMKNLKASKNTRYVRTTKVGTIELEYVSNFVCKDPNLDANQNKIPRLNTTFEKNRTITSHNDPNKSLPLQKESPECSIKVIPSYPHPQNSQSRSSSEIRICNRQRSDSRNSGTFVLASYKDKRALRKINNSLGRRSSRNRNIS